MSEFCSVLQRREIAARQQVDEQQRQQQRQQQQASDDSRRRQLEAQGYRNFQAEAERERKRQEQEQRIAKVEEVRKQAERISEGAELVGRVAFGTETTSQAAARTAQRRADAAALQSYKDLLRRENNYESRGVNAVHDAAAEGRAGGVPGAVQQHSMEAIRGQQHDTMGRVNQLGAQIDSFQPGARPSALAANPWANAAPQFATVGPSPPAASTGAHVANSTVAGVAPSAGSSGAPNPWGSNTPTRPSFNETQVASVDSSLRSAPAQTQKERRAAEDLARRAAEAKAQGLAAKPQVAKTGSGSYHDLMLGCNRAAGDMAGEERKAFIRGCMP